MKPIMEVWNTPVLGPCKFDNPKVSCCYVDDEDLILRSCEVNHANNSLLERAGDRKAVLRICCSDLS
jgi:hypothetical protein